MNIGRRVVLLNRVGPDGPGEPMDRELDRLEVERLADVPQDDEVERAGALEQDVFSLAEQNPALAAVRKAVEKLQT